MKEQKTDISKIRRSEERIRTYIENSSEAIWCIELERSLAIDLPENEQIDHIYKYAYFSEANDVYARVAGYERGADMAGLRLDNIMPRSMPESITTLKKLIRARYAVTNLESVESGRDGNTYHLLNNVNPIIKDGQLLRTWGSSRDITARVKMENRLRLQLEQIQQLQQRIAAEYTCLQEDIKLEHNFEKIIGNSDALRYVLYSVSKVAPTDAPVLIMGETGTGKELIARAVHHASKRNDSGLVKINCAALPAALIESELFGHEKGAFTGADTRRMGRFELADNATLFLDEISEIPIHLQAKLLRVLQDGEFEPLGSSKTIRADVRIIAASNRNLDEEVNNGRFRKDLMFRLNVFPITVPPLRNRIEDIPLLVNWFLSKYNRKMGRQITTVPEALIKHMQRYDWPGNIRELENVIARCVIRSDNSSLEMTDKLTASSQNNIRPNGNQSLADVVKTHILSVLEQTHWKIEGVGGAAEILGLAPSTLRDRMKKLGIHRSTPLVSF